MDAFARRLRELITRDVKASLRKEEQSAATPSEVEALVNRRLESIAECIYRVTGGDGDTSNGGGGADATKSP